MKKTEKYLTAILACVMVLTVLFVLPIVANAEETAATTVASDTFGTEGDNLTWVLTADGELIISGTGAMADYTLDALAPWSADAASIKKITIGDGITSIGDYAFMNCALSTEISIPEGVISIGDGAFSYCYNLKNVAMPEGVASIGDYAFYYCVRLPEITIPASVTSIGRGAVANCKNLATIKVADNNDVYCSEGNCLIERDSKTLVAGCYSSVIPATVIAIGDSAFSGCSRLAELVIPEGVTSIDSLAFQDCTHLTSVAIPVSVTKIGEGILAGCDRLEAVTVAAGNSVYRAEGNCVIETATNTLVAGFRDSVISENVIAIGDGAFLGCRNLAEINVPANVTAIGDSAFFVCSSLDAIFILNDVTVIDGGERTLHGDTTIYGYQASTSDKYATRYSRVFVTIPHEENGVKPVYTAAEFKAAAESTTVKKIVVMRDIYLGEATLGENGAWVPTTVTITTAKTITSADNTENKAFTVYRGIPSFSKDESYDLTDTQAPMFKVEFGQKVILEIANVIFDGQKAVTDGEDVTGIVDQTSSKPEGSCSGCFYVYQGTLVIEDGAVIQNFMANAGAAIYIASNGNVIMNGGLIQYNDGTYRNKADQYAGSVVYNSYGDFVMRGGKISNNTAKKGAAAVYTTSGHFWMYGGEISDNVGVSYGGAIRLRNGHFYMYGGTIRNNEASGADSGHAVYVNHINAKYPRIVLAGGTIENNGGTNGSTPIHLESHQSYLYIGEPTYVYGANGPQTTQFSSLTPALQSVPVDEIGSWEQQPLVLDAGVGNPISYGNPTDAGNSDATATGNTYLGGDLMPGSRLVFEDTGEAFMTLADEYTTPNGATLEAIRLRGADSLYNPIVSDGTLKWPTEAYRIVESSSLRDMIDFHVFVAFRNSEERQTVEATFETFDILKQKALTVEDEPGRATHVVVSMAPKQMTDAVKLKVNGEDVDDDYTLANYLVKLSTYAANRKETELANLAEALLNYGSAAQLNFNYNTGKLANSAYQSQNLKTVDIEKDMSLDDEAGIFHSAVVNVSSKVSVAVVVNYLSDLDMSKVEVTLGGKPRAFTVQYDDSDQYAAICILNISAAELMEDIKIKAGSSTLTYSVPVYAERMQNDSDTANALKDVVKALYAYADAAQKYVASVNAE